MLFLLYFFNLYMVAVLCSHFPQDLHNTENLPNSSFGFSGNALHLYMGAPPFESRPEY
jgi:hypothetical protein